MHRGSRRAAALALALCVTSPLRAASEASAATTAPRPTFVDTAVAKSISGVPVLSGFAPVGTVMIVTARGTYSLWSEWLWSHVPGCGKSEAKAVFPSPSRAVGAVGLDAQFMFARADHCDGTPLPVRTGTFQIDNGSGYAEVAPLVGGTRPSSDHAYSYAVRSTGAAISVRLNDPLWSDNYGRLRLTQRRADDGDCTLGQWAAIGGFASAVACTDALPALDVAGARFAWQTPPVSTQGKITTLTARLASGDRSYIGQRVQVLSVVGRVSRVVLTTRTRPDGTFTLRVRPSQNATYRARVVGWNAASPLLKLAVAPSLTAHASQAVVFGKRTITVTGTVARGQNVVQVRVQRSLVATGRPDSRGRFTARFVTTSREALSAVVSTPATSRLGSALVALRLPR